MRNKKLLKRITASLTAGMLVVSLAGCAGDSTGSSVANSNAVTEGSVSDEESKPASGESTSTGNNNTSTGNTDNTEVAPTETEAPEEGPAELIEESDFTATVYGDHAEIMFYNGNGGDVEIPSEISSKPVTRIGANAFTGIVLTSVVIPDSVTEIGEQIFKGQETLASVKLSKNLTFIPKNAFSGCKALTEIDIPNTVTCIGENAFSQTGLTSVVVPDSVEILGDYAFGSCSSLASVDLGKGVKELGAFCLEGTAIKSLDIPDGITKLPSGLARNAGELANVSLPDSIEIISNLAFADTAIAEINIPDSVNYILYDTFANTPFWNSQSGDYIVLGDGVMVEYRGNSKNIVIPDNVKYLTCTNSMTVTTSLDSFTLGPNVVSITNAFNLKKYMGNEEFVIIGDGILINYNGSERDVTIPDGVKEISGAFSKVTGVEHVTIPDSVVKIDANAFNGCTDLRSIDMPDSVEYIGAYAFQGCNALESIVISKNVKEIGREAFKLCENLERVEIRGTEYIDEYCFEECPKLKDVILPDNLKSIGERAFYKCSSLSEIIMSDSVTSVGNSAFGSCINLKKVIMSDNIDAVEGGLFTNCYSLRELHMPANAHKVAGNFITACYSLKDIYLGKSIETFNDFYPEDDGKIFVGYTGTIHVESGSYAEYYLFNKWDDGLHIYDAEKLYSHYMSADFNLGGGYLASPPTWNIGMINVVDESGSTPTRYGKENNYYRMKSAFRAIEDQFSGVWYPVATVENGEEKTWSGSDDGSEFSGLWMEIQIPLELINRNGEPMGTFYGIKYTDGFSKMSSGARGEQLSSTEISAQIRPNVIMEIKYNDNDTLSVTNPETGVTYILAK